MLEFWLDEYHFVMFDGRVLEVFTVTGKVESARVHLAILGDVALETDRKGRVSLRLGIRGGFPFRAMGVAEAQVPAAQQLVAAITAARGG